MIEQVDEYIQNILAVPYSSAHSLSERLLERLKKDFFTECFVHSSYDINKNIHNLNEPVKSAFEIDLPMKELLDSADLIRNTERAFFDWMNSQQHNVYYVRGDAGT